MEWMCRPIRLGLLLGAILVVCAPHLALAQWEVEISIKQTDGRWKDTLVAGDTNWLEISITNPDNVAAYVVPLKVTSETHGAFATLLDTSFVNYVGRMSTLGNPFTLRPINPDRIDGTDPDSILFGAVEFGSNYLVPGSGIVIEYPLVTSPYVGDVRIDSITFPPSNILSLTDPNAVEWFPVFNATPVFPVVLRVPNDGPTCGGPSDIDSPFGLPLAATITGNDPESDPLTFNQVSGPGSTTSAGDWSWTPDCADVGTYEVCVTVSDPNHLDWDTCCFMVDVTQDPPTVNCVDQVVHYADTLNFFIDGDDDGCPQPLVYTLTAGPGSVNPATGEYTWTPGCGNQGLHFVDVRVWDGQDTALCTFGVTVTNNPPQITCPPNFSSGIGDTVDFVIPASDPDGDSIVFTLLDFQKLSGPTPGGPNFAPSLGVDGHFVWPTTDVNDDDFGVWEVSLRVDEPCDSAFCTFQIDVTPNRPPV